MFFSEEQILQLAPDTGSLKAGKDLAVTDKWQNYFFNTRVVWGEVQGSGKESYRTQIDSQVLAFNCSCASRKFPCKHGIGLMFLISKHKELFKENNIEPVWVKKWIDKRTAKATKPIEVSIIDDEDEKNNVKKAQQKEKRDTERLDLVMSGVNESLMILKDLLRMGLLAFPEKGTTFFLKSAARMIDAKATGLAKRWKKLSEINYTDENWHEEVLSQLAEMYLLAISYQQTNENLKPQISNLNADINTFIGFTKDKKELLEDVTTEKIKDDWLVLSSTRTQEEDLMIQKNWLYGNASQHFALILEFKHKTQAFEIFLPKGNFITSELVFYPSVVPQRAILNQFNTNLDTVFDDKLFLNYLVNWNASQKNFIEQTSQLPFLIEVPQCIKNVTLERDNNKNWFVTDAEKTSLPIPPDFDTDIIFQLLAITGGINIDYLFLIRTTNYVSPLGIVMDGKYWAL